MIVCSVAQSEPIRDPHRETQAECKKKGHVAFAFERPSSYRKDLETQSEQRQPQAENKGYKDSQEKKHKRKSRNTVLKYCAEGSTQRGSTICIISVKPASSIAAGCKVSRIIQSAIAGFKPRAGAA